MVSRKGWSEEETAILNRIHKDQSRLPSKEVMEKLCKALPERSKKVIRAKASNIKKTLIRRSLNSDLFSQIAGFSSPA